MYQKIIIVMVMIILIIVVIMKTIVLIVILMITIIEIIMINDNEPSRRTCDWDLTRVVQTVRRERRLSGGICIIVMRS